MKWLLLGLWLLLASAPAPARAQIFDDEPGTAVPRYDPGHEALRSLVLPGWSQFRQGHDARGWGYSSVAVISMFFAAGVADVPVVGDDDDNFGQVLMALIYGFNAVLSGFDAYNLAVESNRENGWDVEVRVESVASGWRLDLVRLEF
jgi:hypothetical protein